MAPLLGALSWATAKETIKQYYKRSVVIFMKIRCFYPSPHRRDMVSLQVNNRVYTTCISLTIWCRHLWYRVDIRFFFFLFFFFLVLLQVVDSRPSSGSRCYAMLCSEEHSIVWQHEGLVTHQYTRWNHVKNFINSYEKSLFSKDLSSS